MLAAVPCARGMTLLLLLACVHPAGAATFEDCIAENGSEVMHQALREAPRLDGWSALRASYATHNGCDYAELVRAYAHSAGKLLTVRWWQLARFEELSDEYPAFGDWVIEEIIGSEMPQGDLGIVFKNAGTACPAGLGGLCERIAARQADIMNFHYEEITGAIHEIVVRDGDVEVKARVRDPAKTGCSYAEKWLAGKGGFTGSWVAADDKCPSAVMDRLEIRYKGAPVSVPAFSYNDISDVRSVYPEMAGGNAYHVRIRAGDFYGDDQWGVEIEVVLRFEGTVLVERIVHAEEGYLGKREGRVEYVFDAEKGEYGIRIPEGVRHDVYVSPGYDGGAEVSAIMMKESPGNCNSNPTFDVWGDESFCPTKRLERIIVTYNGEPVHVPVSAYRKLSAVQHISLVPVADDSMYAVRIDGHHYNALLFFEHERMTRSLVRSVPIPLLSREETEYH